MRVSIFEWCLDHLEGTRRAVNHSVQGVIDETLIKLLEIGVPGPAAAWRRRLFKHAPPFLDQRNTDFVALLLTIPGITEEDLLVAAQRGDVGPHWFERIIAHPRATRHVREAAPAHQRHR